LLGREARVALCAGTVGLDHEARTIRRFATNPHGNPGFRCPARLLAKLVAESRNFNE
jgi:hypothetical protein